MEDTATLLMAAAVPPAPTDGGKAPPAAKWCGPAADADDLRTRKMGDTSGCCCALAGVAASAACEP
jgi:hypothetical protein